MSTFERYFIHFLLIIYAIAIILMAANPEPHITKKIFLLCIGAAIIFFVTPMALFFSWQESTVTMELSRESEAAYKNIIAVIEDKTGRIPVSQSENTLVYSVAEGKIKLLTKYKRWLTNDITIKKYGTMVKIETPHCYQKYFHSFE